MKTQTANWVWYHQTSFSAFKAGMVIRMNDAGHAYKVASFDELAFGEVFYALANESSWMVPNPITKQPNGKVSYGVAEGATRKGHGVTEKDTEHQGKLVMQITRIEK